MRGRGVVTTCLLAALMLGSGTGCTGHSAPRSSPPSTSEPSTRSPAATSAASPDPSASAATAAVAVYQGYLQAFARAAQIPNPDDPELSLYLADPLLSAT